MEDLKAEFLETREDMQRVVQISTDDKMAGGAWKGIRTFQDLDVGGIQRDGEVVAEVSGRLEAEDVIEFEIRIKVAVDIG